VADDRERAPVRRAGRGRCGHADDKPTGAEAQVRRWSAVPVARPGVPPLPATAAGSWSLVIGDAWK
jgi:hypothetical protein